VANRSWWVCYGYHLCVVLAVEHGGVHSYVCQPP
jgi:hypothetical protein